MELHPYPEFPLLVLLLASPVTLLAGPVTAA